MPTLPQNDTQETVAKEATISFRVSPDFKRDIDVEIARQQTTLQEFATRCLAEGMQREEKRRRRA